MNLVLIEEGDFMENVQLATGTMHQKLGVKHVTLRKQRKNGQVEIRILENVQKIGKEGFGSVFSATWLNSKKIVLDESHYFAQLRTPSFIVAFKTTWLTKEFFKRSKLLGSNLEVYGLTQTITNNEYMMVFNTNKAFIMSNKESINMKSERE
ncbi:hypothetical protein C2G38_2231846 [Gigaspora rosea]|uniref:Uncharacterized protein n=1 Tax=Gigaspora rosea TaxID=44941 RepID=A0A397TW43_9GLOM|nr:hypothetical protein C2G38_2231846 [Gigaspora rosea]